MMMIKRAAIYPVTLPLVRPFQTSYGCINQRELLLLELKDELGNVGYGEVSAFDYPDYTEETIVTVEQVLIKYLLPLLKDVAFSHPEKVRDRFRSIQGNDMAKAAVEMAVWDLYGKRVGQSLHTLIGGTKETVNVGVSIGIEQDLETLVQQIKEYVSQGYQRVKLKIRPGYDLEPIRAIRHAFPALQLMADANSAYRASDIPLLKKLDAYHLAMIEQPFGARDFVTHSLLQKQMMTTVCLDEAIRSLDDVKTARALDSARAINVKISRVGGLTNALEIVDFCVEHQLLVWCGGMLSSGIGRAADLALSSMDAFTFPGDVSASNRYFLKDIIVTEFVLEQGQMTVPKGNGLGVTLSLIHI